MPLRHKDVLVTSFKELPPSEQVVSHLDESVEQVKPDHLPDPPDDGKPPLKPQPYQLRRNRRGDAGYEREALYQRNPKVV